MKDFLCNNYPNVNANCFSMYGDAEKELYVCRPWFNKLMLGLFAHFQTIKEDDSHC